MNKLYEMAIDPNLPLESRYAALQIMLTRRKYHGKQLEKNARQRKYNTRRKDWREMA